MGARFRLDGRWRDDGGGGQLAGRHCRVREDDRAGRPGRARRGVRLQALRVLGDLGHRGDPQETPVAQVRDVAKDRPQSGKHDLGLVGEVHRVGPEVEDGLLVDCPTESAPGLAYPDLHRQPAPNPHSVEEEHRARDVPQAGHPLDRKTDPWRDADTLVEEVGPTSGDPRIVAVPGPVCAAEGGEAELPQDLVESLPVAGEHEAAQRDASLGGHAHARSEFRARDIEGHARCAEDRMREGMRADLVARAGALDRVEDVIAVPERGSFPIRAGIGAEPVAVEPGMRRAEELGMGPAACVGLTALQEQVPDDRPCRGNPEFVQLIEDGADCAPDVRIATLELLGRYSVEAAPHQLGVEGQREGRLHGATILAAVVQSQGFESHYAQRMPQDPRRGRGGVLRILYPEPLTVGGAERQLVLLAEHLPRDRFEVNFVLLGGWTDNADLAVAAGANVRALGASHRRSTPMPIFVLKVAGRALEYVRICRHERFDIVDAWLYMSYGLAAVTRPLARVPVLITGRRSLSAFKSSFGPLERAIDAIARRGADVIVANSGAVADDVSRREGVPRASIRVIRNGVRIPEPMTDAARSGLRRSWGAQPGDFVIGCVGSMKRGKGQDRVVDLLPDVVAADPTARLVLVGGGPLREAIEARIAALGLTNRVVLTGDVPDARPLYGAFDLLVSASDAEGLPNAVLEAAAAGIGIVATAAGGTGEILTDGIEGILVAVPDDASLRAGVIRLAGDAALRQRLGGAARERAATAFSIERFVGETAALYEEMAARHEVSRRRLLA